MEVRNIIGLVLIGVLAYFLFTKTGIGTVFTPHLTLKVTNNVNCWSAGAIYKYCYYDPGSLKVEVSEKSYSVEPLAIRNNPANVHYYVQLTYPNGNVRTQTKDESYSTSGWKKVYFSFPLSEHGTYRWYVKVCGDWYGMQKCDEKSGSYVW